MKLWRVDDVMTRDVVAVRPETPYREVVQLLIGRRVSAVPVVDGANQVVGIVSEADLLLKITDVPAPTVFVTWRYRRDQRKAHGRVAGDVMTAPAVTVRSTLSVSAAARRMQRERVKRLPVEDDLGRLIGIVTRSDLLKVQLRSDEELGRDVAGEVLRATLPDEAAAVRVATAEGVVTLTGRVHYRSAAERVARLSTQVPGVVAVTSELTYDLDDSVVTGSDAGTPFGVA